MHTEDGYILKLYRIKGAKNSQNERKDQKDMKVVLLQHGLFVKISKLKIIKKYFFLG